MKVQYYIEQPFKLRAYLTNPQWSLNVIFYQTNGHNIHNSVTLHIQIFHIVQVLVFFKQVHLIVGEICVILFLYAYWNEIEPMSIASMCV